MKRITSASLLVIALATGCRPVAPPTPTTAATTTATAPPPPVAQRQASSSVGEFHREDDPAFTESQRRLIAAARERLATSDDRANDAFHRVRATDGGHEVFVLFVTGYEGKRPQFTPCHHAAVQFAADGTVTNVLRGPSCWP